MTATQPCPYLTMWAVYDHPTDYPDAYVARRWEVTNDTVAPTGAVFADKDLDAIRAHLMGVHGMSARLDRQPDDDPVIVETWI